MTIQPSAAVDERAKNGRLRGWLAGLAIYGRPRLVAILLMGFSSGLPLALTFGTLSYWLAEIGVSLTTIGLFGLVRSSYSLKFLWSPVIDRLPLPFLTARLGRRRSWALLIQVLLALAILALGFTDPRGDPGMTALAAVIVAFLSASQDIVIDAYRIELLLPEEQGAGAAATQWGYRFGMLAAGRRRALRRELRRVELRLRADGGADAGRDGDGVVHPRAGRDCRAGSAAGRHRGERGSWPG